MTSEERFGQGDCPELELCIMQCNAMKKERINDTSHAPISSLLLQSCNAGHAGMECNRQVQLVGTLVNPKEIPREVGFGVG